jgi:hypothetical protein
MIRRMALGSAAKRIAITIALRIEPREIDTLIWTVTGKRCVACTPLLCRRFSRRAFVAPGGRKKLKISPLHHVGGCLLRKTLAKVTVCVVDIALEADYAQTATVSLYESNLEGIPNEIRDGIEH